MNSEKDFWVVCLRLSTESSASSFIHFFFFISFYFIHPTAQIKTSTELFCHILGYDFFRVPHWLLYWKILWLNEIMNKVLVNLFSSFYQFGRLTRERLYWMKTMSKSLFIHLFLLFFSRVYFCVKAWWENCFIKCFPSTFFVIYLVFLSEWLTAFIKCFWKRFVWSRLYYSTWHKP